MTVKKFSDFRFLFFFIRSIFLCSSFVLNFQTLIRKISVYITQKLQKHLNFLKIYDRTKTVGKL